jgi:hypothetical protein
MSEHDLAHLVELWLLQGKDGYRSPPKTHDGLRGTNVLAHARAICHLFGVILDGFLFGMMNRAEARACKSESLRKWSASVGTGEGLTGKNGMGQLATSQPSRYAAKNKGRRGT